MALDPRISLATQTLDVGSIFNNALSTLQRQDAIKQQRELAPIQQQIAELNLLGSQQAAQAQGKDQELKGLSIFGAQIAPLLERGDIDSVRRMVDDRISQNLPTNNGDREFRQLLETNPQAAAAKANDLVSLGNQLGVLGGQSGQTAGTREFNNLVNIAQDPNSTKLEKDSANRALGNIPREVGAAAKTVDVGGVPHIFDPVKNTLVPARIEGEKVTSKTVGESKAAIRQREKFGELTGSSRAKAIDKGFARVSGITKNINNIDRALGALDRGAGTGAAERFFPSIKAATRELNQIQGELALDVIGSVTFGALSQGELDLAKDIALDTGLSEPDLKDFLQRKKVAQVKLRDYFNEQIQFLDQGGTVAGFLRSKQPPSEQPTQQPAQQVGQFNSAKLGRVVTEQDIQDTLQANPGMTREQLFQQLGIQ